MRFPILFLALAAAASAWAGEGCWYFDIHTVAPTFTGHCKGIQDGSAVQFDLVNDLALARTGTPPGASIEYQGSRFALELSMDRQDYGGSNTLNQTVQIGGQTFSAQARLTSTLKVNAYTGNGTIRIFRWPSAWIGLDLGVEITTVDLDATAENHLLGAPATAIFKYPLRMPQLGPAAGFKAFGNRLVARGHYHFLAYQGATYHHAGADVRYFPLPWLGIRAFVSGEGWRVPDNSIAQNLEIGLERNGAGFGLVARF